MDKKLTRIEKIYGMDGVLIGGMFISFDCTSYDAMNFLWWSEKPPAKRANVEADRRSPIWTFETRI